MRYDRPKGGAKVSTAFRQLDKNMLCSFTSSICDHRERPTPTAMEEKSCEKLSRVRKPCPGTSSPARPQPSGQVLDYFSKSADTFLHGLRRAAVSRVCAVVRFALLQRR